MQIEAKAYADQKPGTSGLRKRVKVFQQPHYTALFIQSILTATSLTNGVLVVGGDGRFYSSDAIQIIINVCAANGISKLIIGQNGILSTPAASHLIRKMGAHGGILLTASHNPGGPDRDFGIKYNIGNGGPAPESVTNAIYAISKELTGYGMVELDPVDLSKLGSFSRGSLTVEIVDSVQDYLLLMKDIFDFESLKTYFKTNPSFRVLFDSMHGVTGPYAKRILVDELGLPLTSVMNYAPLPDFGGGHPDPNLTVPLDQNTSDGDGDRNMIIGKGTFVNPSDSVAVIAANAEMIPYFKKSGVKGLARSMPTSGAIDLVAKKKGYRFAEVPTGWKFFGNLMDAGVLSICGEESFGTGSDHIREKDGVWAVLAWLSILAETSKTIPGATLQTVLNKHYSEYGRNYFSRYDYEEVETDGGNAVMAHLQTLITNHPSTSRKIVNLDDFQYVDPIDGSVSEHQGIRIIFEDGCRIIFRLSGTGSQGVTIRLYVEKVSNDVHLETSVAVKDLIDEALTLSRLVEFTGRKEPTVIT